MEVVADNSLPDGEPRAWLNAHKAETGLSWPQLGRQTDVASSTLSAFAAGTYAGNNTNVAAKVLAYRDRLSSQAKIARNSRLVPAWYDTPTADRLTSALHLAQSGDMVLIVTSPGIGKTKAAERFAANDPNVWMATMSPATAGVSTMAIEIAAAIGLGDIKGSPQQMGRQIKATVRGRNGLLIIDEAQELTDKALNELRSWHDQTGLGIALMGNESVVGQIDGRKTALAQISSRILCPFVLTKPESGDVEALCDAWSIHEKVMRDFLAKVAALPGALRSVTHTLKIATMAAAGTGQQLSLAHLRDAARQRNLKIGGL